MANTPFLDLVKPAGTDRALVSVINSNSDKIDTGVSTLSEQIATNNDAATYTKLSDIKSALNTLAETLSANQTKFIRIHTGTDTSLSPFTGWNDFIGYMQKQSSGYWIATLVGRDGVDVTVTNNNGTMNAYSLSDKIATKTYTIAKANTSYTYNGVYLRKCANVLHVKVRGLVDLPNGNSSIFELPVGCRPTELVQCDVIAVSQNEGTGYRVLRFGFSANGSVTAYNYGSALSNNNGEISFVIVI